MLVKHSNILKEVVEVQQIRQTVAFRGLDDIALFRKFDTAVDTSTDDFS